MNPLQVRSVEVRIEPGRPASIVLELSGGIRVAGVRVWRTPRGPRVVLPLSAGGSRPGLSPLPSTRRDWELSALEAWRRAARATDSVSFLDGRRAA